MAIGLDRDGYLPATQAWTAALFLALSNFMVILDLTIANVSVPHIAGNLGVSPDQGTWIITSYAVAEAICVPLTGWLSRRFGTVKMLMGGLFGFTVFSFLCGASTTLSMIVGCRIAQGMCGGPIMPMTQTLMFRLFPPEKMNGPMAIWAMTTLLGPALGPILGGYISDNWSWHWIFFINLPIGVVCMVVLFAILKPMETPTRREKVDFVGLLLLAFWIGCLQIMLDIGRDHDWFDDPMIVLLAVGAVVGFGVFVIWELTAAAPIVDLRVFRHRSFAFGVMTLALCFGAYFASIVVIPQWLQAYMGYTAFDAGLATAFTALAALTTSGLATRLMLKGDVRIMISLGISWLGIMALVRTHWTSDIGFWIVAMPQLLQGFAVPFFIMPLMTMSLSQLPQSEMASGAGMQNFARTMAVAVSTSLVLTFWGNAQRVSRAELVSGLDPEATQATLSQNGFGAEQSRQIISNIVENEAVTIAVNHSFWMTACVLFAAAILVWCAPRPPSGMRPGGGH